MPTLARKRHVLFQPTPPILTVPIAVRTVRSRSAAAYAARAKGRWIRSVFPVDPVVASIVYNVYSNGGSGPVNYNSVVFTTPELAHVTLPMGFSSTWIWAVRAKDTTTGLEEQNVDARVTIIVGSAGADISAMPNAPTGLAAVATASGTAKLSWAYNPGGQGAPPTGFHVYFGTPTPDYGTIKATVPYGQVLAFSATISGLADLTDYQVAVRAYNPTAEEKNTNVCPLRGLVNGPSPVSGLTATVIS